MRDPVNVHVLLRLPFVFSYKLWQKFKDKLNNTLPIGPNMLTADEEYTRHNREFTAFHANAVIQKTKGS